MNIFAEVRIPDANGAGGLAVRGRAAGRLSAAEVRSRADARSTHGDVAVNAALVLAKSAKMKPRDIAEALKKKLEGYPDVAKVEVAGPGFLNITFKPGVWHDLVRTILQSGVQYGAGSGATAASSTSSTCRRIRPDRCTSGIVAGPFLAMRSRTFLLSRAMTSRASITSTMPAARSTFWRARHSCATARRWAKRSRIPDGFYPGDYLKPVGEALAQEHGRALLDMPEEQWLPIVRSFAIGKMMAMIKDDLAALNIRHDVFFSEASLTSGGRDQIKAAVEELRKKGLIYEGKLEKPKGHDDADWEDRSQTLFKSTAYGDDEDRAIQKSDGSYTYFAGDVAYHYDKLQRGFRHLINVFGADHVGYISRMKAAVAALSDGAADLDVKVVQLVRLFKAGEPYKMSKRAGTFVTLRDVVDEVGRDPVRFMMLYRKNQETLDFDFAKVTEQSKDNPVFYVQYAHARAASVLRNAVDQIAGLDVSDATLQNADLTKLVDPGEIDLIKRLAAFPRLIEGAASAHEPHRLAFYLYDLASGLHGQWTRGNDSPHLRFIQSNDGVVTSARLALIAATKSVIKAGLEILGVEAPDAMR